MTSVSSEQPGQEIPREPPADREEPASAAEAAEAAGGVPLPSEVAATEGTDDTVNGDTSLADDAMTLLSEHKGKLAIGVAATLGLMVYYGWREKRLAKTDPEEYARLQRIRAIMRQGDEAPKARSARRNATRPDSADEAGSASPAPSDADTGQDDESKPERS